MSKPTAMKANIPNLPATPAPPRAKPVRPGKSDMFGKKQASSSKDELDSAISWMRGAMVRELVRRMRRTGEAGASNRTKRKTALAMSAAVMAASPGAVDYPQSNENVEISALASVDATQNRVDANNIRVSDAMKEALAEEEGVRLTVYRDVAGYPTVGVGHLVLPEDNLKVGDTITYEKAIEFLEEDLKKAEAGVRDLVGDLPIYQHEFDALVDLVYNVGAGNVSESESPKLNAAINAGDYAGIASELNYHHAAGQKANGLVFRSERRQAIFENAEYHDPRPIEIGVAGNVST